MSQEGSRRLSIQGRTERWRRDSNQGRRDSNQGGRRRDESFASAQGRGSAQWETASFKSVLSSQQLIPSEVYRTSPARWYILFSFCFMGLVQGFIGNSWGPVSTAMKTVYGWTDKRSSLLALWTPLMFVPGALLFPWLTQITNVRTAVLGNATLMALAGTLKVLSLTVIPMNCLIYTAHTTQLINGLCGAVPFSAIMYITVNWFPVKEQLIATGVIIASLNTGVAFPFILGPSLVPEPNSTANYTLYSNYTTNLTSSLSPLLTVWAAHNEAFYRTRLRWYMIVQGACMVTSFLLVLVYFPSKPRYAPTASAINHRATLKEGILILMKRRNFWLSVFMFSLTTGGFNGYGLALDVILEKSDISQALAGYIGFGALLASVPANLIVGTLGALFPNHKKLLNVGLLGVGTVSMFLFVAQVQKWFPRFMPLLVLSVILGVMCLTGAAPLLFDMATEGSAGVSEELSSTIMVLGNQTTCLLFLALLQIPGLVGDEDKDKLNYVLLSLFSAALGLSALYTPTTVRRRMDASSITVDQLDYRSVQQIENAGIGVDYS